VPGLVFVLSRVIIFICWRISVESTELIPLNQRVLQLQTSPYLLSEFLTVYFILWGRKKEDKRARQPFWYSFVSVLS
jgi:hypothetical protein